MAETTEPEIKHIPYNQRVCPLALKTGRPGDPTVACLGPYCMYWVDDGDGLVGCALVLRMYWDAKISRGAFENDAESKLMDKQVTERNGGDDYIG